MRRRRGRKRATGTRAPAALPQAPNQRWSLDFVSDCLVARRFRILVVVDDFTRECLAAVADTSISGARVARELDALIAGRGRPNIIVSDNGPELTSRAILAWTNRAGLDWHYIAPGKPTQNAAHAGLPPDQARLLAAGARPGLVDGPATRPLAPSSTPCYQPQGLPS